MVYMSLKSINVMFDYCSNTLWTDNKVGATAGITESVTTT